MTDQVEGAEGSSRGPRSRGRRGPSLEETGRTQAKHLSHKDFSVLYEKMSGGAESACRFLRTKTSLARTGSTSNPGMLLRPALSFNASPMQPYHARTAQVDQDDAKAR